VSHDVGALGGPGPQDEPLVELREHQVVAAAHLRAGAHRRAEARGRGRGAVDRDDERGAAARAVVLVRVGAAEEHAVLDPERRQLACPDAQEREWLRVRAGRLERDGLALAPPDRERDDRRERPALGAERPHRVVEVPAVAVGDQRVVARGLLVADAGRQVVHAADLAVDDGAVRDRGPDDRPPVLAQQVDQDAEVGPREEPGPAAVSRGDGCRGRRDGRAGGARIRGIGHVLVVHHGWTSRRPSSSRANRSRSWSRVADRRRATVWSTRG
jgi:hypothetical protein